MLFGGTNYNPPSRFLKEDPDRTHGEGGEAEAHLERRERRGRAAPRSAQTKSKAGDRVRHDKWGLGTVREVIGAGERAEAEVIFDERRQEAPPPGLGPTAEDFSPRRGEYLSVSEGRGGRSIDARQGFSARRFRELDSLLLERTPPSASGPLPPPGRNKLRQKLLALGSTSVTNRSHDLPNFSTPWSSTTWTTLSRSTPNSVVPLNLSWPSRFRSAPKGCG